MGRPPKVSTERILDTTRRLFSERGPALALSEIAGELEISAPALIGRFGTKDSLLEASLSVSAIERWLRQVDAGTPQTTPLHGQIEALWTGLVDVLEQQLPVYCGLRYSKTKWRPAHPAESPPVLARQAFMRWLRRVPDRQKSSNWDPVSFANLLVSSAESAALGRWLFPEAELDNLGPVLEAIDL